MVIKQLEGSFLAGFRGYPLRFADLRDATPNARGSTHGHFRRFLYFWVEKADSERDRNLEEVMADLPSKIPAIERLQWGVDPSKEHFKDSELWGVLFTFEDAAARDACLAHPAYKEFEELTKSPFVIEYIATDDWSF